MSAINQEKLVEEQPRPVSIEGTREILSQMENCTCIIYKEDGKKGTGFFCKIPFLNYLLPVLITNNHVLNENDIENDKIINLSINNEVKKIKIDNSRKKYTNPDENIDITIIEIRQYKDGIYKFLEVDKTDIYKNKEKIELEYKMKSIYVLHYPKEKLNVSYGLMKDIIDNQKINHYCNTEEGSSGAPILSLETYKIIGIHYGSHNGKIKINYGVYIKYIIDLFNNFNKNKNKNEIKKYQNIISGDDNNKKITDTNPHTITYKNISKKNSTNFRENINTKYNVHNIMKSEKNTPSNINNSHFEFKSLKKERNIKNTIYKRSSSIPNNEILNESEDLNSHIQSARVIEGVLRFNDLKKIKNIDNLKKIKRQNLYNKLKQKNYSKISYSFADKDRNKIFDNEINNLSLFNTAENFNNNKAINNDNKNSNLGIKRFIFKNSFRKPNLDENENIEIIKRYIKKRRPSETNKDKKDKFLIMKMKNYQFQRKNFFSTSENSNTNFKYNKNTSSYSAKKNYLNNKLLAPLNKEKIEKNQTIERAYKNGNDKLFNKTENYFYSKKFFKFNLDKVKLQEKLFK